MNCLTIQAPSKEFRLENNNVMTTYGVVYKLYCYKILKHCKNITQTQIKARGVRKTSLNPTRRKLELLQNNKRVKNVKNQHVRCLLNLWTPLRQWTARKKSFKFTEGLKRKRSHLTDAFHCPRKTKKKEKATPIDLIQRATP